MRRIILVGPSIVDLSNVRWKWLFKVHLDMSIIILKVNQNIICVLMLHIKIQREVLITCILCLQLPLLLRSFFAFVFCTSFIVRVLCEVNSNLCYRWLCKSTGILCSSVFDLFPFLHGHFLLLFLVSFSFLRFCLPNN